MLDKEFIVKHGDGSVTLGVDYTAADGTTMQGLTAKEDFASYNDPLLQEQTVTVSGSPAVGASLVVRAECDAGNNVYVPDYWNQTFESDWDSFLAQVATHYNVDCPSNPLNKPLDLCTTAYGGTLSTEFDPFDVLYVRGGVGLFDEGTPYNSGSVIAATVKGWAAPSTCGSTNNNLNQSSFAGEWEGWQRCTMATEFNDFYYSSIMDPVVDPSGESLDSVDTAEWAMNNGMSIGQDGLQSAWANGPVGTCKGDDPGSPCGTIEPDMQTLNTYSNTHDVYPTFAELQTYESMTQDCTDTAQGDYEIKNGPDQIPVRCTPYSQVTCNSTTNGNNGCADTTTYKYTQCAAANTKENTFLAQSSYYSMTTTLEVYYTDLDDTTNSGVVAAYNYWFNQIGASNQTQLWPSGSVCPIGGY